MWGERGNDQSRLIFNGRRKTRRGGPAARYGQNWRKTAAYILTVCIGGRGRGCRSQSDCNGDSDSNRCDDNDRMGMGGPSCYTRNRLGSKSRSPQRSCKKMSRGTDVSGASKMRSRSGSRCVLGSKSRCRRLWREKDSRSRGGSIRKNDYG